MLTDSVTDDTPMTVTRAFFNGVVKILPLCFAVLPWGLLAGSMAIQAGLTTLQAVGMSALVFAGAAQLMTLGLVMAGTPALTIIISVFLITTQHYLYALYLREDISRQPLKYRLMLGFLLTDELFAVSIKKQQHYIYYLLGAGSCFYLCWVLFSLCGVLLAASVPNLDQYHLDFSIVATFIAIVIPFIKNLNTLVGVLVSVILTVVFLSLGIKSAAILAGVIGMLTATCLQNLRERAA
ncbi:AzlC family ABC transporter permease [Acinetobacter sp. YK3]|uniref:AzlC family ABC transporter permease n=1 Tax=Acinetobacter sp. YK3 TaxID=1860097 RepID=UPI00084BD021|nr:AzlC family ABC transporter permease [Acinetobacter sp. YK3]OEC90527.1 branched-chain amino acid ABC transporter permease [Acinetobacter sp. YK3]